MKKSLALIFCLALAAALYAGGKPEKSDSTKAGDAKAADGAAASASPAPSQKDLSYAFGMILGSDLKNTGMTFNYAELMKGIEAVMEGKDVRISTQDALAMVRDALRANAAKQAAAAQEKEMAWLAENGKKPGVVTTDSGLQYQVLTEGTGPKPVLEDTVRVNYEGKLTDGTVFDSTYERGEPAVFPLKAVIPGWTEGLSLLKVGSTAMLYIPSELAYGPQGADQVIPPYSTLVFKVELLEIVKVESQEFRMPE